MHFTLFEQSFLLSSLNSILWADNEGLDQYAQMGRLTGIFFILICDNNFFLLLKDSFDLI